MLKELNRLKGLKWWNQKVPLLGGARGGFDKRQKKKDKRRILS
jgi:hypothetical protein